MIKAFKVLPYCDEETDDAKDSDSYSEEENLVYIIQKMKKFMRRRQKTNQKLIDASADSLEIDNDIEQFEDKEAEHEMAFHNIAVLAVLHTFYSQQ